MRAKKLGSEDLTILFSFPAPHEATNPYLVMLARSIAAEPGVTVLFFSWRTALLHRYDVFHTQWPELMFARRTILKTAVRRVFFVLLLIKLWLFRIPMVRTLHNVTPHEQKTRVERILIRCTDRRTAAWIRLNASTVLPTNRMSATVLHGHYREWFARYQRSAVIPGSVLFAGQIRPYKNVTGLIRAFRELPGGDFSLRVVGKPAGESAQRELIEAAREDPRISFSFGHVSDEDLVTEVSGAELVVLPYTEMHNSGAALLALSLGRPVLVPDNEITAALAAEVGQNWVQRYSGTLSAAALSAGLSHLRQRLAGSEPDLHRREWTTVGADHLAIYRRALRISRPRSTT